MFQPCFTREYTKESRGTYAIKDLTCKRDAKRIIDFFLSEDSFDDRNFTNGEIIQMNKLPYESLKDSDFKFWYVENERSEIIGVISVRENEQKTGGYCIDYITVHKEYRKRGISTQLMDVVIEYVKAVNGRYIHANTCDTELYNGVKGLFNKKGFHLAGRLPNYYFEGESMITYYKTIDPSV